MNQIELKKIELENGETMAYRHVKESGDILVLVHGFQSSSQFFEDLLKSFDGLNIYAVDLIGYGDSTYRKKHKNIRDWAKDLSYFLKAVNLDKINLLGWSFGGQVCMDFASLYKERVKNLILVASVGTKGFIIPDKKSEKFKLPNFLKDFRLSHNKRFTIPILNGIRDKDIEFFKDILRQTIFNVNDPNPDDLRKMAEDFLKQRCFLEALLAMARYDNTKTGSNFIENITMPVTWLHGKKDMVVPIDDAYKSIEYFPKEVKFIKFDKAGHALFVDEKERFVRTIKDVLS